jgi:hypothetical protein
MDDQSVDTEVAAEERLLAAMGEDDEPQEDPEIEPEDGEDQEEPEGESEEPEIEYLELVVNGEQVKKSKAEVLELAQKGEDYTRKTQQLAEERRALQAQMQAAQQQQQMQSAVANLVAEAKAVEGQLAQYKDIDWNALVDADPVQAMKLNLQYRELQAYYQGKVNDINQTSQQVQSQQAQMKQEMLVREHQAMLQSIPDWADKTKFDSEVADIRGFLANTGFNADEIGSLVDHRHVIVARKAMLYDKLMAGKPAVTKKVAEAPKPVKSTAPQTTKSKEAYTKTRQELRKTGRTEYAERAIEALL